MGKATGFVEFSRVKAPARPVAERLGDYRHVYTAYPADELTSQSARCMDCGVPFCQGDTGCPVQNLIPEWNDLVHRGQWREALDALHATNNFPELTGRLCPAPCESACVLGLVDRPVAIRSIEQAIAIADRHDVQLAEGVGAEALLEEGERALRRDERRHRAVG